MLATIGSDISDFEAELRTREFAQAQDVAISDLAGDAHVIALASEAVIGSSVPDFTEEIRVRTEALARAYAAQRGATLPRPGEASGVDAVMSGIAAQTEAMRRRLDPAPQENAEAME